MGFIVRVRNRRLFLHEGLENKLHRLAENTTRAESRYVWGSQEAAQVYHTWSEASQAKTEAGQRYPNLLKDLIIERQANA